MEPESSSDAFDGKFIRVAVERWPSGEREVVHHPGAAAIVALTADDQVVLVRQMREAVREELLEIPAGVLDVEGESPLDCALRELTEETGHVAASAEHLCTLLTSPGFADERIDVFLARDVERRRDVAEEGVTLALMAFADAVAAIGTRIVDAKTVTGLLLTERSRGEHDRR